LLWGLLVCMIIVCAFVQVSVCETLVLSVALLPQFAACRQTLPGASLSCDWIIV
jgi:hypothetical protein